MVTDARGLSRDSTAVDAIAKRTGQREDPPPRLEQNPADDIDIDAGWPPRVPRETKLRAYSPLSSARHCTVRDRQRAANLALSHQDVRGRLSGRWELLGCHQECPRDDTFRLRVVVFNYTSNELVEAIVENEVVTSVVIRDPHEHPESPVEMAQAIGLARSDPSIAAIVRGMEAHAILQIPADKRSESAGHRCLLVVFTDRADPHRELPVRYSALVDLRLQKVIVSGPSPCEVAARSSEKHERTSRPPRKGE